MDNFGKNLLILLGASKMSQAALAKELGDINKKSTINKWIIHGTQPDNKVITKVAKIISEKLGKKIHADYLINSKPITLGLDIGLTRNEISEFLFYNNFYYFVPNNQEKNKILHKCCGTYDVYMPSWVYEGMINHRILRIYYKRDAFYFHEVHGLYKKIPKSAYSGYVLSVGRNLHLIGEELESIYEHTNKDNEMTYAILSIPSMDNISDLKGICLGSNPVEDEHLPISSPYCAIRKWDATSDDDIYKYLHDDNYEPYISIEKLPENIRHLLGSVRQSWFSTNVNWE